MTQHILKMVKESDSQTIMKYVKNHLPNDPVSLERIYKELQNYEVQPDKEPNMHSTRRTKSVVSLSSASSSGGTSVKFKNTSKDQIIKTTSLIKRLKDKGLKVVGNLQEEGQTLYESHRQRLVKPLITNTKLLKSQEALIDKIIHRYTINREFYKDKRKRDQNTQEEDNLDPEMKDFLTRRESLLEVLRNENTHKSLANPKFNGVQSKFTHPKGTRLSYQQIPRMKQPECQLAELSSSKKLMVICQDEIRQQKYKTINPRINYFRDLSSKIQSNTSYDEYAQLEDPKTFRQKISAQQYKRYTNSYIDMLTKKMRTGSKCKLSVYDKDLLRDAKKMRNIIDFSSQ